jgi:hypothetical protein
MPTSLTSAFSPETIRQHGLTPDEYEKIRQLLGGREPTITELGIFSVMWSEHCSYKSSRVHLKRLPTRSKRVLQGPGENAGIIQDRIAQSSVVYRALSGGDHRSGRDFAGHFHHGSAARCRHGFFALWACDARCRASPWQDSRGGCRYASRHSSESLGHGRRG